MFRMLVDSMVNPKGITNYVDDKKKRKFVEFIFLLAFLLLIPTIISLNKAVVFSNSETNSIISTLKENSTIDYKIDDGKLIYTGDGESKVQSIKFDDTAFLLTDLPVYVVFSLSGTDYKVNDEDGYVILFKETSIDVIYAPYIDTENEDITNAFKAFSKEVERKVKNISYDNLSVNFNYLESSKNSYFNQIYSVGAFIYNNLKLRVVLENSLINFISALIYFSANMFFTVLIIRLCFRSSGVSFGKTLKIVILTSMPYAIGSLIGYLYDLVFLTYIGELISLIYTYRVFMYYVLLKKIKERGDN